jgi:outer membrane lipoprotein SlyB
MAPLNALSCSPLYGSVQKSPPARDVRKRTDPADALSKLKPHSQEDIMKRSTLLPPPLWRRGQRRRASNEPRQVGYVNNEAASYGTIESIQVMQPRGSSGAGAVTGGLIGGLLGNQVGSGGGRTAATVAGAVGGAVVGNNVENKRNAKQEYQISVRMDNGDYRIVSRTASTTCASATACAWSTAACIATKP